MKSGAQGLGSTGSELVLPPLAAQILWIHLISDAGPALDMGVDSIANDTMGRPLRRRSVRLIDSRMCADIAGTGIVRLLPDGLVEGPEDLALARTAGFTVLVLEQLFNCFNARCETRSAFRGLFTNRWLWAAGGALPTMLQVAVIHLVGLNRAFGTVPLSIKQWGGCLAMASGVRWFSELRSGRFSPGPQPNARFSRQEPSRLEREVDAWVRQRTESRCCGCQTAP